jgi:transcriptional repressor NrdR
MRCPYCFHEETKVIDSRPAAEGRHEGIRRRRECLAVGCGRRFTTFERVQLAGVYVIKKDGRREEFSREKLMAGVRKACEKRPLASSDVEGVADYVEAALTAQGVAEVQSPYIGELVMERLRELDGIAYIRFASVYRSFADVEELKRALTELESRGPVGRPAMDASPPANQLPLLKQDELASLSGDGPAARLVSRRRKKATDEAEQPVELRQARG